MVGGSNKKILILDDSLTARKMIAGVCHRLGYGNTVEIASAQDALIKLIVDNDFELIICDFNMPVMTGMEFLASAKNNPNTKGIPFIFFSAESESRHIMAAMKLGADAFLVKPVPADSLKKTLERLLGDRSDSAVAA